MRASSASRYGFVPVAEQRGPCLAPLGGAALREYREHDLIGVKSAGRARVCLEMDEQLDDFFLAYAIVERDPQLAAQRLMRAERGRDGDRDERLAAHIQSAARP